MKAAIVQFSQEALVDLLQLPAGARISRVWVDNEEYNGPIRFRIEGAGFECLEGMRIRIAYPTARWKAEESNQDSARNPLISWGFQESTKTAHDTASMSDSPQAVDALVSGKTG